MAQNLKFIECMVEFSRPANTTAYAANKVVSDGATVAIPPLLPTGNSTYTLKNGASYQVKSVQLVSNSSGTTNATFDLYLYSSGVTAVADQGAFNPAYADKTTRIGKTTLSCYTGDTNTTMKEAVNTDVNHVFRGTTYTESNGLGFLLVATAAYTPTSAEKFFLKVTLLNID